MADPLDHEIARINKMHLDAGYRTALVRRVKRIYECLQEPDVPVEHIWCLRCGFLVKDHDSLRSKLNV
jgi:hypothetical protein